MPPMPLQLIPPAPAPDYLNPNLPAGLGTVRIPVVEATADSLRGYGLLLIIAKDDRKMRFEVAKTLEGAIPDLAASRIINQTMKPAFRAGDFAGGIDAALGQAMGLVDGEPLPEAKGDLTPGKRAGWVDSVINIALLALLAVTVWKLGISYKVHALQAGTFELFRYYGGAPRSGVMPLLLGVYVGRSLVLGLDAAEMVLLVLTMGTAMLTFSQPRTHVLLGCVHLLLFGAYFMLMFD